MTEDTWQVGDAAGARWIFPACAEGSINQYADFLHVFDCPEPGFDAELLISADTDFIVWLNGVKLGCGQYSNYPQAKTYERFAVGEALLVARNTLAVTVFYNGRTSSVYERGEPGLIFELRAGGVQAVSGTQTLCRANPCYHSGPIAIVSGQLAYTFGYDARHEDAFHEADYEPGTGWRPISDEESTVPNGRTVLLPRPIPSLVDGGKTAPVVCGAGQFRYDIARAEAENEATAAGQTAGGLVLDSEEDRAQAPVSPGWLMQYAELAEDTSLVTAGTPVGAGLQVDVADLGEHDGVYVIVDQGCEEVGHLELSIEAPEGTIVDIGYGEHLDDGRVRSFVGRRSFAGRYICGPGQQHFTHPFLRWAGRYLQVCVHTPAFRLSQLSLHRCDYPVAPRGDVSTGRALHERIHEVGCRTLRLCMHEHYEDTPWREQALYANDARTQALCGYYAFGETAMPAASFALLGNGLREDGFLNLTAPAKPGLTIPSFTLVWMLAVRDHFLYSGDDSLARQFLPQITSMLQAFLEERRDGLLPLRRVKGIWHFYDWSAGMSGYTDEAFDKGLDADAPLNCFLVLALDAAAQIRRWCGEPDDAAMDTAANELRQAVAERFWDASEGIFRTHRGAEILTELTQALAVLAGVGDDSMRAAALARMARPDSGLSEPGLSQSFYTFEALMSQKDKFGPSVLDRIETTWGKMLKCGATTFWETIRGASDFSNAGSLCHGWSAVPVYVLYHDVLGVRPLEPGFRTFAVEPMPVATPACSGCVPVPDGEIAVNWVRTTDGSARCNVRAPEGSRQSHV